MLFSPSHWSLDPQKVQQRQSKLRRETEEKGIVVSTDGRKRLNECWQLMKLNLTSWPASPYVSFLSLVPSEHLAVSHFPTWWAEIFNDRKSTSAVLFDFTRQLSSFCGSLLINTDKIEFICCHLWFFFNASMISHKVWQCKTKGKLVFSPNIKKENTLLH